MQRFKKLTAILLTSIMVLSISAVSFAADTRPVSTKDIVTAENFDYAPFKSMDEYIKYADSAFLPVRPVAELAGFTIKYDGAKKQATITKDQTTLIATVGENKAVFNGQPEDLTSAPFISKEGRMFMGLFDMMYFFGLNGVTAAQLKEYGLSTQDAIFPELPEKVVETLKEANEKDGGSKVVNPLTEYKTVLELTKATGVPMTVPVTSKMHIIQSIAGKTNELGFFADKMYCNYRKTSIKNTELGDDISGVYYTFDKSEKVDVNGKSFTVKTTKDPASSHTLALVVWKDNDYKYSLYVQTNYDKGALTKLLGEIS